MRKVSPSGEVSAGYPLQPVGFPLQSRVLLLSPCPFSSLACLTLALSNQQQSFQEALDIGAHDRRGEAASQVSSDQAHLLASLRGTFPQAKTCDPRLYHLVISNQLLNISFHRFQLEQEVWSQCLASLVRLDSIKGALLKMGGEQRVRLTDKTQSTIDCQ